MLENVLFFLHLLYFTCFFIYNSIRVSNELGAGQPQAARKAAYVALVMVVIEGILVGFLMILLRDIWGRVYSEEEDVIRYLATMMPTVAVSSFLDGVQSVLSGSHPS